VGKENKEMKEKEKKSQGSVNYSLREKRRENEK
jgi:hypothetical protein